MTRVVCAEAPANEIDCKWHLIVAALQCDRPVPVLRWCVPADGDEPGYVDRWGELLIDFACYDVGPGDVWLRSDLAAEFDLEAALYLLTLADGGTNA